METLSAYDRANIDAKGLIDSLHSELRSLVPSTDRHDAKASTSFGATNRNKYVFAFATKTQKRVQIYFFGNAEEPPIASSGMRAIMRRPKLDTDWADRTPYYTSLENITEVQPLAAFLFDYSFPRSVPKRAVKETSNPTRSNLPEEVSEQLFQEGHATRVTVNRYERDPKARAACLAYHKTTCAGCTVNLEERYGPIARGFIHVHHVVELSKRKGRYTPNPKTDLIPLCPNCHAVTHLATPPLSLEQLKQALAPK